MFHPNRFSRRHLVLACTAVAVAGLSLASAFAEPPQPGEQPANTPPGSDAALSGAQLQAMIAARSAYAGGNADAYPSFDAVSEGMEEVAAPEGTTPLFKVYKQKGDNNRDPAKLLALIPRSLLGDDLLLATTVTRGPAFGNQWSDYLIRFEQRGRNVVLSVPDLNYIEDGSVTSDAVKNTYTPSILASLTIEAMGPGGELVVDMGDLVTGGAVSGPVGRGPVRRDLTEYEKVKLFPENVLIDADVYAGGRTGAQATGLGFSFRRLPEQRNPMTRYWPRGADERIGYFETIRQDWNLKHDVKDTNRRFINRWRLEKLDDSLEMSPPKEPIVFYIEKTVPIQWRRYVKDGIEAWNKAFEDIGIVGAIEVRQQTDTAYDDIDPEDARYNFIRWIVTGQAYAMGPSRVDPRTGQILDADIVFDDSMLRYFQEDLNLLSPKEAAKTMARDLGSGTLDFWQKNPAFIPMGLTLDDVRSASADAERRHGLASPLGSNFAVAGDANAASDAFALLRDLAGGANPAALNKASRMSAGAPEGCEYADGVTRQLALAQLAMVAQMAPAAAPSTMPATKPTLGDTGLSEEPGDEIEEAEPATPATIPASAPSKPADRLQNTKLPERYLGLVLKEVVAHEVGHTLGLRHNFKASSWLSLDEVKKRQEKGTEPIVASVMDYNPIVLFAGDDPKNTQTFITPCIGPYDEWAIQYGYTIAPRGREENVLEKIASRAGEKPLAYATDEDNGGVQSPDPYVNTYDMGDDPVAWSKTRIALVDKLMSTIDQWAVDPGEPNDYLRRMYMNLWGEKVRNMIYVSRLVGGQHFSRAHFDDPIKGGDKPGLTPLDPAKQREAVNYLAETLFQDDFLKADPDLLNKLVPSRSSGVGESWPGYRLDFPVHAMVLRAQNYGLSQLTNPTVLQRLYDAQLKTTGDDKFTAAEEIRTVTDAVWGDLKKAEDGEKFTDSKPMLGSIRRNLQEQHLTYLLAMADSEPGDLMSADLRTLVRYQLRMLADRIEKLGKDKGDAIDMASMAHLSETADRIEKVLNAPHIDIPAGGGGTTIIMMGQDAQK